jgi:hypothetical protein
MSDKRMRAILMSEISSQLAIIVSLSATLLLKKIGNVYINKTLRCVQITIVAMEKQ